MLRQSWKPAAVLTTCLATQLVTGEAAESGARSGDPAVITHWNAVAERTIFAENGTPVPSSGLYFSFTALAVYDAIVAIRGGYQPYLPQPRADRHASTDAAAVTAAYEVLSHYFPASGANLAADYATSLAAVPDGPAKDAGSRAGHAAAAQIIETRANDGRNAPITLQIPPAPGVWRPTPDAYAPMVTPWLGFVDPLAIGTPTHFDPPGQYALTSPAYARDWTEARDYGAATGSLRTPEQTQTGLFWNANVVLQFQSALRNQVTARGFDQLRSARAFAMLATATADALIGCWRTKYDDAFWRPITAIREADTDGNAATTADPAWTPLAPTPAYPDYVSGHACIMGATTGVLAALFGPNAIDLDVASSVTGTTRHYANTRALDQETINARIFLGFHFRKAMVDGNALGHRTATYVTGRLFRRC